MCQSKSGECPEEYVAFPIQIARYSPQFVVDIDYKHFEPSGTAWITMSSAGFAGSAVRALRDHNLAGLPLTVNLSPPPRESRPARLRGVKGRAEAAEREVVTGDGPGAGITGGRRTVVLSGLPARMSPDAVRTWLKNFKLASSTPEEKEVSKIGL